MSTGRIARGVAAGAVVAVGVLTWVLSADTSIERDADLSSVEASDDGGPPAETSSDDSVADSGDAAQAAPAGEYPNAALRSTSPATSSLADQTFLETFDGAPAAPTPWNPPGWDVVVHSRDVATAEYLEPMDAVHGDDCSPPPDTHSNISYDGAVYLCRDHMMTAVKAEGYAAAYLTPAVMVDLSKGEAVIKLDMSTFRGSERDWWDIWITPFEENLVLPLEEWLPDLQGPPRNAIQIRMDQGIFRTLIYRDGVEEPEITTSALYDEVLEPDMKRRDTFEARITTSSISFGMPAYGLTLSEGTFDELDWTQGVVTFAHHAYNPEKCAGCVANTWHWDNVSISPAVPFTMIKADRREYQAATGTTASFPEPSPKDAWLRFSGIGSNLEVSFDGGSTWVPAGKPPQSDIEDHFSSYMMPMPSGVTEVQFRGGNWLGEYPFRARDVAIWARQG